MSIKGSFEATTPLTTPRSLAGRHRGRTWLAAVSATALTVGLIPIVTASPASAAPDPCVVTITPSVNDDSITLGQTLDDSLTAASGNVCGDGATFYLGTTDDTFVYQLPKSLEWTSEDTLAIIGVGDDTPILLAAGGTRVLTVANTDPTIGPATVDLTRLSIRGGRVSTENGGGVFLEDATVLTLRQMEFLDNQTSDPSTVPGNSLAGGAVAAWEGTVVAITSRFEGNRADDGGGALSAKSIEVQGSDFIGNAAGTADGWGGALWNRSSGSVEVGPDPQGRPSRFIENTAFLGGAIALQDASVSSIWANFQRNSSAELGGAIATSGGGALDVVHSSFEDDSTSGPYGGGAIWADVPLTITDSTFIGTNAPTTGGAIVAYANTTGIQDSYFEGTSSPIGGAIAVDGSSTTSVTNSTFRANSADDSGSGVYVASGSTLTVTASTFIGITASGAGASTDRGGAIYAEGDADIQDSYFEGNSAISGAAIAGGGSAAISVTNSTFWGNSADDSGSGIYAADAVALTIVGSTFDDSTTDDTSLIAVEGSATASLAGTILSKDASPASPCEGSGSVDDSGGNLVTATCGTISGTSLTPGASAIVSDDSLGLLAPALNMTYPTNTGTTPTIGLEPSSVAINRYTTYCPGADQRGAPRPQGTLCDAGAYEAGGIESITPPGSTSASVGTAFTLSLSASGFDSGTFVWDDSGTTLPPGLTLSSTGVISGTPTTPGTYAFTARVTGPVDDSTTAQTITVPGGPDPNPPGPTPATPASPPQDVRAVAGIEAATVSWLPPASTGTFPVTSYQAVATPGGQACMASAPALTCTITGLTAGTSYTVTARALTGAGWSAASSPGATVVPLATPEVSTILIASSRDRNQKSIARIEGTTTGLVGAQVVPYIRVAGKSTFSPGKSTRTVDADGTFTWQRTAKKRFTVYFASGDVTSNRLVIRPE